MINRILYPVLLIYTAAVYGSMAVMSIGAGIIGAGLLSLYFMKPKFDPKMDWLAVRRTPLFAPTVFISVACIWSLLWAKMTGLEFYGMRPNIDFLQDSRKLWHIFFPFVILVLLGKLDNRKFLQLIKVWLGIGLLMAVFGIVQYYYPVYSPQLLPHVTYESYKRGNSFFDHLRGMYHATGLTGFHLSFASIIAFPTSVWFAWSALSYKNEGFTRKTRLLTLGSVIFFIANLVTYSKTTWAIMPLLIVAYSFGIIKGRIRYILMALLVAGMLIGVNSSEFKLRFQGTDTIKERLWVWSANVEMIKENPVFGVGWHHNSELSEPYYIQYGIRGFISHAHNNVLDQFSSTGVFGLIGFLWWNFIAVALSVQIFRLRRGEIWNAIGLGMLGGWFVLHAGGLTQTNFWDAKVMHQMGLVTAFTLDVWRRFGPRSGTLGRPKYEQ